jgi:hypothetical protein
MPLPVSSLCILPLHLSKLSWLLRWCRLPSLALSSLRLALFSLLFARLPCSHWGLFLCSLSLSLFHSSRDRHVLGNVKRAARSPTKGTQIDGKSKKSAEVGLLSVLDNNARERADAHEGETSVPLKNCPFLSCSTTHDSPLFPSFLPSFPPSFLPSSFTLSLSLSHAVHISRPNPKPNPPLAFYP